MTGTSAALASFGVVVLAAAGCRQTPVLTQRVEALRLAADLRLQFSRIAEASNRAVMAETDEASDEAAREAETVARTIQQAVQTLQPILRDLAYAEEIQLLHEFEGRFAEYRTLDGTLLVVPSRRQGDVGTLALQMGRHRTLTAACDESLRALQAALQQHDVAATR
jgi:hypothetical protein